ncbi:MAG: SDR family oxidoreductase [Bacteroidales bacterium]|nr:SDR family oxidoreductase [Bacteroidales bacterium]
MKDHAVIITGASSGIGKELAFRYAKEGAWLALAARDKTRLEVVAEKCRSLGGKAISIPTDVADEKQCKNLVDKCVETYGKIDVLVNNAGITMWAYFEEVTDLKIMEKIMQVNYFGSVYCTHYSLPYIKKSKGRLVGVSSLTGKAGIPTRSGYGASKHAMAGFFDTLRVELKESGVSVTMIYPGFVSSEVRQRAMGGDGKPIGKSPVKENEVMSVEKCVDLMIPAIVSRKREVVMTLRGKLGMWLKLIVPGLVDRIALKAIRSGR